MTAVFSPRRAVLLLGLLLPLLLGAAPARAWWNKDWALRVKITADASPQGANITEPIGRTQVLLRLHSGNFDFSTLKDDGSDLRFVAADDKTPLHFHVEKFDAKDQVALVWIDLPDMAPGTATSFFCYWNNDKATDGGDSRATYDPDQLLVYHFGEENGLPKDATGFSSNALTAGTRDEAGLIGYGLRLDRDKPLLRIGKSLSLAIPEAQPMTFSMWLKPEPASQTAILFSDREGADAITIGLDGGTPYAQVEGPGGTRRATSSAALPADGWHQLVVETTDHITIFLDGKEVGSAAGSLPAINGQPVLGGAEAANAPRYVGLIDEFGIAKVARPVGALQAAFASEGPDGKLLSLDQPEQGDTGGPNPFVVIFRSVTADAWVVIGLLAVMASLSWFVTYSKTTYLNRLGKANHAYHAAYRKHLAELSGDHMAVLATIAADSARIWKTSSLHRLTVIAVKELEERLTNGMVQAGQRLAPESLAAIRARMETGAMHEAHHLSAMMVLLVIAISGGPFLGLLGTVVGVMLTFAAIAAAGDVNVNAIAPGIAAALLATAAGMFVAIPAMFAYNYLLLRIKDANTDMAAFVNETITRMGEARARMLPEAAPAAPIAKPAASPAPPPAAANAAAANAAALREQRIAARAAEKAAMRKPVSGA